MTDITLMVPGDALAEGEMNKVIQAPNPIQPTISDNQPEPPEPDMALDNSLPTDEPQLGCGHHARKPPGVYCTLHEGHMAAIAQLNDADEPFDLTQLEYMLLTAGGFMPHTFDEALQSPNHHSWQKTLDYEIGQLEKLGTWVIEDLVKGQTAIPCSMVLKEK